MIQAALAVGCGAFPHSSIPRLEYCSSDAKRFIESLHLYCGLPPSDSAVLVDENEDPKLLPSRNNIARLIAFTEQKCRQAQVDRLFVFLSGHGLFSSNTGELYYACRDTFSEDFVETSISID